MKKLVFIAIIASLVMAGCTQKEPEKKAGNSDKKATTENVELATCDIKVEKRRREWHHTSWRHAQICGRSSN